MSCRLVVCRRCDVHHFIPNSMRKPQPRLPLCIVDGCCLRMRSCVCTSMSRCPVVCTGPLSCFAEFLLSRLSVRVSVLSSSHCRCCATSDTWLSRAPQSQRLCGRPVSVLRHLQMPNEPTLAQSTSYNVACSSTLVCSFTLTLALQHQHLAGVLHDWVTCSLSSGWLQWRQARPDQWSISWFILNVSLS